MTARCAAAEQLRDTFCPDTDHGLARMKALPVLYLACILPFVAACTREQLTRTGYETLQNIGKQQCERDPSAACTQRSSYEEYRRERAQEMK